MQLTVSDAVIRPLATRFARSEDAALVHQLYSETPHYFEIISIPMPTLGEVRQELALAGHDGRRHIELLLSHDLGLPDSQSGQNVVGYLDYKLEYPGAGDAIVNLLLISGKWQSQGLGRSAATELESRLKGKAKRVLVSIYGQNPRAERFWKSLGYTFAIDAKPVLDWYAKAL
ncbi:MAG: GNAT family N-acetyltransferase [Trueperaceae bacterium]